MLAEAYPHIRKVYLAVGYTDYPRSIVIREELITIRRYTIYEERFTIL